MESFISKSQHQTSALLPGDIFYKILCASQYLEGDAAFPPTHDMERSNKYIHRYTRFALLARRVCRLWRDIIDMRSSYWFRVTAAELLLDVHREDDELVPMLIPAGIMENQVTYRSAISHSKTSMLALDMTVDNTYGTSEGIIDPAKLGSQSKRDLQEFLLEIHKLVSRQNRILKLDLCMPPGTFRDFLLGAIQSFSRNTTIRQLTVSFPHSNDQTLTIVNQHTLLEASGLPSFDRASQEPLLHYLTSLEYLSLSAVDNARGFWRIPPSVTELVLINRLSPGMEFAEIRSVLDAWGSQIKTLTAKLQSLTLAQEDLRRPISLPNLERLSIGDSSLTLANFLFEVDCPRLQQARVEFFGLPLIDSDPPSHISSLFNEINPPVHLPLLKKLDMQLCGDRAGLPLEALSLPSLQTISFNKPYRLRYLFQPEGPSPPILERISALPIRSLAFDSNLEDEDLVLFKYLNLQNVQHLRLNQTHCNSNLGFPLLSMPQLRYLEIEGSMDFFALILDHLLIGDGLTALRTSTRFFSFMSMMDDPQWLFTTDLEFEVEQIRSPPPEPRAVSIWREGGLDGKFCNLTTLVLPTTNGEDLQEEDCFLQLCLSLTTLIFSLGHIDAFERHLLKIDPISPFNSTLSTKSLLPKLQHVVYEFFEQYKLDDIHAIQGKLIGLVAEVDTHRQASGAISLSSVTFSLCTKEFEEPLVEEYLLDPEKSSIYRVRIANQEHQPSSLLSKLQD